MKNWIIYTIQVLFSFGLFLNAALFLPQLITLLKTKNTHGISITTFAGFNFIQLVTILHGYLEKDYLLMIGYIISFIACGSVTCAILVYKNRLKRI